LWSIARLRAGLDTRRISPRAARTLRERREIMESVAIIKRVEDDWVDLLKVRVAHGGGEVVALLAFKDDPE
jgi:hypothetical protein